MQKKSGCMLLYPPMTVPKVIVSVSNQPKNNFVPSQLREANGRLASMIIGSIVDPDPYMASKVIGCTSLITCHEPFILVISKIPQLGLVVKTEKPCEGAMVVTICNLLFASSTTS